MAWIPVLGSTQIIGYEYVEDEDDAQKPLGTGKLWIQFIEGDVYLYKHVPLRVYQDMQIVSSVGSYFHRSIKGKYAWDRISIFRCP